MFLKSQQSRLNEGQHHNTTFPSNNLPLAIFPFCIKTNIRFFILCFFFQQGAAFADPLANVVDDVAPNVLPHYSPSLILAFFALTFAALLTVYVLTLQRRIVNAKQRIEKETMARTDAENELKQSREQFRCLIENTNDFVWEVDHKGRYTYVSHQVRHLLGYSPDELLGQNADDVIRSQDNSRGALFAPLLKEPSTFSAIETLLQHKSGHLVVFECSGLPFYDQKGCLSGYRGVNRDVTEVQRLTKKMAYQASHDALTSLLNRREFEIRLDHALQNAKEKHEHHVLCYLNLDQFKTINEMCSYDAGDKLLKQLSYHLSLAMREEDVLARLSGDEFGVLFTHSTKSEATDLVSDLCMLIKDFKFNWKGKVFQLSTSAGLAEIDENSGSLTDILSAADAACCVAKEQGRNRLHWFEPGDAAVKRRNGQLLWIQRVKQALDHDRFCLYKEEFVPLSKAANNAVHYEILLRMIDENGDVVSPMSFIPAAERYNLMPAVDRWVINKTLQTLANKQDIENNNAIYAVNLSGQSLNDDSFLKYTIDQFDKSGVSPERICFEITETTAIANLTRASRLMSILKGMGCHFALDDFGSGLSSFAYLKNLPVDYLKIDGSFVQNILSNRIDYAMVDSINQIGQLMGLQTIAECVENNETLKRVKALGIDFAQGHGIAKIVPLKSKSHQGAIFKRENHPIQTMKKIKTRA